MSNFNNNDKTAASSNLTSEYGTLQKQENFGKWKFPFKNLPPQNNQQNQGYSVLNPSYSDTSSMNISGLPINKNNSAIVICPNTNSDNSPIARNGCIQTCREKRDENQVRF
mgnify:CR=1 FL=1